MKRANIFPDIEQLNTALARKIVDVLENDLKAGDQTLNLALSGGRTPIGLLARLIEKHSESNIWPHVCVYWVDERHVPFDHPESNYGNARPFIEALGIPQGQIYPMGENPDTSEAAREYHKLISGIQTDGNLGDSLFNLTLLGLGPDGHFASLFPGTDHLNDSVLAKAAIQPESGQSRISLTLPALNRSRCCIFMASGGSKAEIISKIFTLGKDSRYPASLLDTTKPALWYMDEAAAGLLDLGSTS